MFDVVNVGGVMVVIDAMLVRDVPMVPIFVIVLVVGLNE